MFRININAKSKNVLCSAMLFGALLTMTTAIGTADVAAASTLRIENAWVRPGVAAKTSSDSRAGGGADMGGAGNSAVYMVIYNGRSASDRLIGAETDVARAVELHQTKIDAGMARMMRVPAISVPAAGRVELKPGGYHVMLIGLKHDLKVGGRVDLVLVFAKAGRHRVVATVKMSGVN